MRRLPRAEAVAVAVTVTVSAGPARAARSASLHSTRQGKHKRRHPEMNLQRRVPRH